MTYLIILILSSLLSLFVYTLEEFLTCHGNDALVVAVANHGIRLATSGLAIRKQGAVVALPGIVQHSNAQVLEHFFLQKERSKASLSLCTHSNTNSP